MSQTMQPRSGEEAPQVILLRLARAVDMFQLPQSDLFSEYRNFLTGVDYCMSELRSRRRRDAVRLDLELPPSEVQEGIAEQIARSLRAYCEHRIAYNRRERRAVRFDGMSSLRVGIPIAVVGLVVAVIAAKAAGSAGSSNVVLDTLGWVLAWVGLWFPLDTLLFSPLAYGRENRVLALLAEAEVSVRAAEPPFPEKRGAYRRVLDEGGSEPEEPAGDRQNSHQDGDRKDQGAPLR